MRWSVVLAVCGMIALAGCGALSGPGTPTGMDSPTSEVDTSTTTSEQSPGNDGTPTETTEPTATPIETEPTQTETVSVSGDYGDSFPTDEVALDLSELSGSYKLAGETHASRSDATGEQLSQLREINAVVLEERAYEASDSAQSQLVFVSVTVFESPSAADQWLSDHLEGIASNGGDVSTHSVSSAVDAQEAKFDSGNSLRTVALYKQESNVVFYVAVAADEDQVEYAESLFVKMIGDLPQS